MRTGWLGRYLDRVGSPDNPLQGLSLDGDLAPSLATGKVPVAALRGAGEYSFWAPGVWGEVNDKMLDAHRRSRRDPAQPRPCARERRARWPHSPTGCAASSRRSRAAA